MKHYNIRGTPRSGVGGRDDRHATSFMGSTLHVTWRWWVVHRLALALLALVPCRLAASVGVGVVYEQKLGNTFEGIFSNTGGQEVADSFVVTSTVSISHVRWYGFYSCGWSPAAASVPFTVSFFSDFFGSPGTVPLVSQVLMARPQSTGQRIVTPGLPLDGSLIYQFDADLPAALTVKSGSTEWLSVAKVDSSTPQWLWARSSFAPNALAYHVAPERWTSSSGLGQTAFSLFGEEIQTSPAADCLQNLPKPVLSFAGTEGYGAAGQGGTRYLIPVSNWWAFPDTLFTTAPDLPPCGLNNNSSRSWVNIYDGKGNYVYGFCGLTKASDMESIWFAVPRGQAPPDSVYVEIADRRCGRNLRSSALALTPVSMKCTGRGAVTVSLLETKGKVYLLQKSTNLLNWVTMATIPDSMKSATFQEPSPAARCFYRIAP
jgi:hypothetical protein